MRLRIVNDGLIPSVVLESQGPAENDNVDVDVDVNTNTASSSGGGSSSAGILVAAGSAGAIILAWMLWNNEDVLWDFTPTAEFRASGSVGHYAYGSRFDYRGEHWSGYWQAGQTKTGGDTDEWIYGTGTAWTGDVFTASMTNTTQGLESNTLFSLSARKEWGAWNWESSYAGNWQVSELNDTWRNRLSLGASLVYDKWTMTPKAEFLWRNSEDIGKDTDFRLELQRDL